jgi:2-polyprenyl-3-methyl-5-hydroxy-6-metoxy-1,4-benzoquinol methylase
MKGGLRDATIDARSAYDLWHRAQTDPVAGELCSPWHELVAKHLPASLTGLSILEIGCGRGELSLWMARRSPRREHVAADFSTAALERSQRGAEALGVHDISWKYEDIQALSFPDGKFDLVISCETIEHVPNPKQAILELSRVLAPGGTVLLSTPNYLGLLGLYRAYLRLRGRRFTEVGQPINHVTLIPRTILWLRAAGLRLASMEATGHYLPWPGRPPIRLRRLNGVRSLRWFALHSFFVAIKPE